VIPVATKGMIVLNVALSGIVCLLLPGGKTAHSRFCIPILIKEESTCNILQGSLRATLLIETKLIIWDEAPMMNRLCFEAFDRTLRDIMKSQSEENSQKPFGGKVVVLGGDFKQILPIVKKGSRYDLVKSTINYYDLWKNYKVLKLKQNMRLSTITCAQTATSIIEFVNWIMKIGNGETNLNENGEGIIYIPEDLLIQKSDSPLLSLVHFVYPQNVLNSICQTFFDDATILCLTIEVVEEVNDFILSSIDGEEKMYRS